MKIIAHRGNLDGPSRLENRPDHIHIALQRGFEVEIDVWSIKDKLMLGHDEPQYEVDLEFLLEISDRAWVHCKNLSALEELSKFKEINVFWHQEDDFVLTRTNHIWTFPGKLLGKRSIAVMPQNLDDQKLLEVFGVCTDYPEIFKMKVG
jgi:hypothetical protein